MKLFKLLLVIFALGEACLGQAQTFTTLKSFGVLTNKIGTVPRSTLALGEDGFLYGTTSAGGGIMRGGVFKIGMDGSEFAVIKQFTNLLEGAFPKSGVLVAGTTVFGTTSAGGSEDGGTVYKMNVDGTGFNVLKSLPAGSYNRNLPGFPVGGGSWYEPNPPMGGLALSGTTLYGTTRSGGTGARGNVFKLETDGSGYAVLKEFSGPDGAAPTGDLVVSGSTLYGTTSYGGSANTGTVFKVSIDGSGFAVLKHFTGPNGAGPYAGLTLSGETLYGVTVRGGAFSSQAGTVFKLNTDGSGFATLKSFNSTIPPQGVGPMGKLLIVDNVLYGTAATVLNYTPGIGTIFRLSTDGTGFATVIAPIGGPSGLQFWSPAGVILSGNTLYGTMCAINFLGGGSPYDQVFKVNVDGTGRTTLKLFDNISSDEARAPGPLTLAGDTLYAAGSGGKSNFGTVFKIGTNGGNYTTLKRFNGTNEGRSPGGRLAVSGEAIFGTAAEGGNANSYGTLFKLDTNGGAFGIVKTFDGVVVGGPAGMMLAGNTVYGVAVYGGANGNGGVYKMNTNGTGFSVLKADIQAYGEPVLIGTTLYCIADSGLIFKVNTDGTGFAALHSLTDSPPLSYSLNRLAAAGNTLYGVAYAGTDYPAGAIFKINTDGTSFGVVKYLTDPRLGFYTSSRAGLLISGATIYGATRSAVFQVNTDGSDFAVIKVFGPPPDGDQPHGDLILDGTTLYGSTAGGGEVGEGTIFRIDLRPRLEIAQAAGGVRVAWPSFAKDYSLEEKLDLNATGWSVVNTIPADDGTNRVITAPVSTTVGTFRLRR